jgi:CHAT domain-containing protein
MLSDEPRWTRCNDPACDTFEGRRKLSCGLLDAAAARQVLATSVDCIDEAILILERFAPADAAARNDLAAAYYLRARHRSQPSDLVHALRAAESAARLQPPLKAAVFNHALLLEEMGFLEQAIEAWNTFLRLDDSDWTVEAREHRDKLRATLMADAGQLWAKNRLALPAALRAGDRASVSRLIAPALSGAQAYLENELLLDWANTSSPQLLAEARLLAEELSRLARDPYTRDVVAALSSSANVDALRQGHRLLDEGRNHVHEGALKEGVVSLDAAARAFLTGKSPLYLSAQLEKAGTLGISDSAEALTALDAAAHDAGLQRYPRVAAQAKAVRGYALTWIRPTDAILVYSDALEASAALNDQENVAGMYARRSGLYTLLGHKEFALRDAFEAIRRLSSIVDAQARHAVLGEIGNAILGAGDPNIAMRFQDQAVTLSERSLTMTPPDQKQRLARAATNVAIARLNRARIHTELQQYAAATEDLRQSIRVATSYSKGENTNSYLAMLTAHTEAVRGLAELEPSPSAAVQSFTKAIEAAAKDEFLTFRARLFVQRAEAKRRARYGVDDIEKDLIEALRILAQEEQQVLVRRKRGEHEELLGRYFSRFQDTYQRLIELYIQTGDAAEAFEVAERARTIDLRNLLSGFDTKGLSEPSESKAELPLIQEELRPDEFLLEYIVYADRTYCWIVSPRDIALVPLEVGRARIEGLVATIHAEGRRHPRQADDAAFLGALTAAYDELLAEPMRRIAATGVRLPRIVIVPDGPMHALPLPALRNPDTGSFLTEEAIVEIGGSSAVYRYSRRRDRELVLNEEPTVLLIGDPAFDPKNPVAGTLPRLRGARAEVNRIAAEYGSGVTPLIDTEATIDAFFAEARTKTIVHFAGHAIVNPGFPSRSVLLMANTAKDGGTLYAADLLTRLSVDRTKLVVLAACSSAGGLPIGLEGVGPLVRPIIAARVPAVVGSLWPVNDATAADVFVSFHASYGKGEDAAAALRTAQVRLIRSGDRKSVYAWAPYQVIGHSSSPFGGTQK